jgi:hypothetical protein
MTYLILSHLGDASAARTAAALAARHGSHAVCVVEDTELTGRAIWRHVLSADGTWFQLTLSNGVKLKDEDVSAVYNRLRYTFVPRFASAKPADREYAVMETFALLLSWLESLGPRVVNRASSQGLGGNTVDPTIWQAMAARAGLPIMASRFTTNRRRFRSTLSEESAFFGQMLPAQPGLPVGPRPGWVHEPLRGTWQAVTLIGGKVFGYLPHALHAGARDLARIAGYDVLGLQFVRGSGEQWRFVGADPLVELEDALQVDALVSLMESKRQPNTEEAL